MISVTVLTKNNASSLRATLASLQSFPEVIVYDTGSTDETIKIAREFPNVIVQEGPLAGFGPTHNTASSLATFDWILSIDSDEVLSDALIQEILNLKLDSHTIYQISRHNFLNGKWIKWCAGWYPDPVVRLYHRKMTRFSEDAVHEKVQQNNLHLKELASPLYHTPYRSMEDFLEKMQRYSSLFAEQHQHTKSASLWKAIVHGWFAFFKSYIFKRGFLGGREGFIISTYNGHTAFYKYLKLLDRTSPLQKRSLPPSE